MQTTRIIVAQTIRQKIPTRLEYCEFENRLR